MDIKTIRVKHFCNPGDAIASLAGLKSYYDTTSIKVIFCQALGTPANYYPGASHGTVDSLGNMVCMNEKIWGMLRPLLHSQEYIHSTEEYAGQSDILIDIDVIRKERFVNLPHGQIQAWIMYAFPDLAYDLSKPWIILPENKEIDERISEQVRGKVLINFTERYRNHHISYFFLRKYKHKLVFAGTDREHLLFMNKWKIDLPKLEANDFLELAYAIKNCQFLLANQSMCWNLAEAMKSPRVLEVCEYAANCMPFVGEKSYGFYHQSGVEYYVNLLV